MTKKKGPLAKGPRSGATKKGQKPNPAPKKKNGVAW
jgi:hypothetical protein